MNNKNSKMPTAQAPAIAGQKTETADKKSIAHKNSSTQFRETIGY